MGKLSRQQLPVVQPQRGSGGGCYACSIGLSRIVRLFSFKCVLVLLLTLALSVYALFSVLPHHSKTSGFDAKESIKYSATAQVYFTLQKPVTELIPHISKLEHEIFDEIAIPSTKVVILSMHRAAITNWTDVVFGVLPNPLNVSTDPSLLSLLRSILLDLYTQESNLTLTNTTFGQPLSFNILKFLGGITLIPGKATPFGQIPEILFNFTLNNSIDEIREHFVVFNRQLRLGLHLMPDENVYVQVTNKNGSTRDPPVVVDASITSESGFLLPQRLKQLAQIISGSSAKNLGLDNSVFGKVKEVILSSCLNHSLHPFPPSPSPSPSSSPSPSPETIWDSGPSLSPAPHFQSDPPAPVNFYYSATSSGSDTSAPSDASHAFAPNPESLSTHWHPGTNSPAPSGNHRSPKCGPSISPSPSPTPDTSPVISDSSPTTSCLPPIKGPNSRMPFGPPSPAVSHRSNDASNSVNLKVLVSPPGVLSSTSASSSSGLQGSLYKTWWVWLLGLLTFSLLCSTFQLG